MPKMEYSRRVLDLEQNLALLSSAFADVSGLGPPGGSSAGPTRAGAALSANKTPVSAAIKPRPARRGQASAGTSQAYTRASTFSGYQFPAPRGDTIEASPSSLSGGEDGGEEGGALHLEPETGAPRTTDPRSVELQTDLRTRPAGGGVSQPALQDWLDQMMPRERTTADARRGRTPPRHAAPPPRQQRDASPPPPRHDRPHRGDSQDPGQAQARPGAARPGAPAGATRGASPGRRLAGVRSPGGGASHGGGAGGRRSASPPSGGRSFDGMEILEQGDDFAPRPNSGSRAVGGLFSPSSAERRGGRPEGGLFPQSSAERRDATRGGGARAAGGGARGRDSWSYGEGGASSGSVSSASSDDMWS
ncbi:hypothetical protein T484DRAFT_1904306, partial [Baffinella frigidus]